MKPEARFSELIYEYVRQIPAGRVMTYGQLAALAGSPRASRQVGGVAHYGPEELPWHRVVNRQGRMASGFHGGRSVQAQLLEAEGLTVVDDHIVGIHELIWWPSDSGVENN